ncbi:unnamed protein product [Lactuca saligna]|uniref:ditrans,polycis-polyprenyl diphosphate synthase [(2E,6E)-farnesyldiphosphate specific] n=1 Tax=Lactuca saligna TaxID=75948 RepID=A0AA36A4W1_LACSI|nr:unnamed protein product [Lactuca saligna]
MVVLGFNEFMTLLRNPLWLLVIFVSYLLAKALWVQLDIYGEFQNGATMDLVGGPQKIFHKISQMRAIESYLIENGIVKTYEDLNLDRVKYLGIVVDSDEARETSKVIELLEWLSDVVWIQGNKATTVKPYNLLGHAITFSSPHRQSWLEKSTSSSQGS